MAIFLVVAVVVVGGYSIRRMAEGVDRMSVAEDRSVLASRLEGVSQSNYSRLVHLMPTMVTADTREEPADVDERTEGLQALSEVVWNLELPIKTLATWLR